MAHMRRMLAVLCTAPGLVRVVIVAIIGILKFSEEV